MAYFLITQEIECGDTVGSLKDMSSHHTGIRCVGTVSRYSLCVEDENQ